MPRENLPGRKLLSSKDVLPASIPSVKRYGRSTSGLREARMTVTFSTANIPVNIVHNLGFVPSSWSVIKQDRGANFYNDTRLMATTRSLVLKCDTAGTTADILIR